MNNERSKADDVGFILKLITKVLEKEPSADEQNVNLIGTSNGAALIYRIIIATQANRPFRRLKFQTRTFYGKLYLTQGVPTGILFDICTMA